MTQATHLAKFILNCDGAVEGNNNLILLSLKLTLSLTLDGREGQRESISA